MSSDRRPAKVRVFSSGTPDAGPARRRGDVPQAATRDPGAAGSLAVAAAGAVPVRGAEGGGFLWVVGGAILFLIGCALGGVLLTVSIMYPGAML